MVSSIEYKEDVGEYILRIRYVACQKVLSDIVTNNLGFIKLY
jgi:hypothetical protein